MVPADFDTTNSQESIVDVITSLIADAKTPILVQPRETTFYNPPINPKTTAVVGASSSQYGLDTPSAKLLAVWFTVVTSITQHRSWPSKGPADLARNSWNVIDQGQQLGNIVTVGAGQSHYQRDTIGISHHMVF